MLKPGQRNRRERINRSKGRTLPTPSILATSTTPELAARQPFLQLTFSHFPFGACDHEAPPARAIEFVLAPGRSSAPSASRPTGAPPATLGRTSGGGSSFPASWKGATTTPGPSQPCRQRGCRCGARWELLCVRFVASICELALLIRVQYRVGRISRCSMLLRTYPLGSWRC